MASSCPRAGGEGATDANMTYEKYHEKQMEIAYHAQMTCAVSRLDFDTHLLLV
jgi:hypothetical protein